MPADQTALAQFRPALLDLDTHPLVLNLIMLRLYGPEYIGWDPETTWNECRLDFGVGVLDANKQKIQAVVALYANERVGADWVLFEKVAAGLVGIAPRLDVLQRATPARAAFALECLGYIHEGAPADEEVYRYCAACMMDYGMVFGPGPLMPANEFIQPADTDLRKQVQQVAARGVGAITTAADQTISVQAIKAISVTDFLKQMHSQFAAQVARYAL